MNLLIIPSWYPPDGGEFFVNQTKWLQKEGVKVGLIYVEQKSLKKFFQFKLRNIFKIERNEESGFLVYRLITYKLPKSYRFNSLIWRELTYHLAKIYLKENSCPDLIHVHSCLWGSIVANRIKKNFKIPYIITEHRGRFNENNFTKKEDIKKEYFKLLRQPLINAEAIIPVSHLQVKTLEEIAGVKLTCYPIPNPTDELFFKQIEKDKNNRTDTVFVNITSFLPCKAPEVLIHSFHQALLKEGNLQLQLVGDGADRYKTENLIRELKIQDKVNLYGFQPSSRVKEIIGQSDFLIVSSYNEGQPVVLGEALLCGKPVIGTNIISEIDIPPFAGYIIPVGNIEKLANAMLKAHKEKEMFNPSEIREFALKRFAKSAVIPSVIEIMKMAIRDAK